jgi:hypothetical protein
MANKSSNNNTGVASNQLNADADADKAITSPATSASASSLSSLSSSSSSSERSASQSQSNDNLDSNSRARICSLTKTIVMLRKHVSQLSAASDLSIVTSALGPLSLPPAPLKRENAAVASQDTNGVQKIWNLVQKTHMYGSEIKIAQLDSGKTKLSFSSAITPVSVETTNTEVVMTSEAQDMNKSSTSDRAVVTNANANTNTTNTNTNTNAEQFDATQVSDHVRMMHSTLKSMASKYQNIICTPKIINLNACPVSVPSSTAIQTPATSVDINACTSQPINTNFSSSLPEQHLLANLVYLNQLKREGKLLRNHIAKLAAASSDVLTSAKW